MFFQGPFKHSTTRTRAHFGSATRARALCHLHTNMPDYEATADPMQLYLANFCLDYPPWKSHTVAWQQFGFQWAVGSRISSVCWM